MGSEVELQYRLAAASRWLDVQTDVAGAFCQACVRGDLGAAQRLAGGSAGGSLTLAEARAHAGVAFSGACINGHLAVAQWLWSLRGFAGGPAGAGLTLADVRTGGCWALHGACYNGHLEVAQWLWGLRDPLASSFGKEGEKEAAGLTLADVRGRGCEAFRLACARGHLEVAQWLWGLRDASSLSARGGEGREGGAKVAGGPGAGLTLADVRAWDSEAFRLACASGHLAIAEFLWSLRDPCSSSFGKEGGAGGAGGADALTRADVRARGGEAFRGACARGDLTTARWLWSLRDCRGNSLTLADVRARGCEAFRTACSGGHLGVVRWLWGLRDPFSSSLGKEGGAREKVAGGPGAGLTLADVRAKGCRAFREACANGFLGVAQWLWALRSPRSAFSARSSLSASSGGAGGGSGAKVADRLTLADVRARDNWAFGWACRNGHLAVARWLWSLTGPGGAGLTAADVEAGARGALLNACAGGRLADAQWAWGLCTHGHPLRGPAAAGAALSLWSCVAFQGAYRNGFTAVARWLWEQHDGPGRLRLLAMAGPTLAQAAAGPRPAGPRPPGPRTRTPVRLDPVEPGPGDACPICLDPCSSSAFEKGGDAEAKGAAAVPAGHDRRHWACRGCLTAWLAEHDTCPVCRAAVRA